jgi:RNAse (barnase) inhibitor barstar
VTTLSQVLRDAQPQDDAHPDGVYQWPGRNVPASELQRARDGGWTVGVVQLGQATSDKAMLKAFQRDLDFPDWFGHNWDALVDALADWVPDTPRLLVLEDVHGDQDAVDALLGVMDLFSIETSRSHGCVVVLTAPRSLDGPVPLSLV